MPILNLQRRHAEIGRIRLGHKDAAKGYPKRLDRFRFTSPSHKLIQDIAELYGGQAKPWDNQGKAEFEVFTEAQEIPVIVVKGGLSQWMETWSGGGCIHRCDGQHNVLTDSPCDPEDPAHKNAKPTTRLSVMLRDVESLGVFRLETHGWNAAVEIPAMAELAMHVGDLVPASLRLVERVVKRDGETSRFVVPVLDLQVTKARLVEVMAATGAPAQIGNGAVRQIEALPAEMPDYASMVEAATTEDELRVIWRQAGDAGHLNDVVKQWITDRRAELTADEVMVDGDLDAAWMVVVMEAGRHGWQTEQLKAAFEAWAAQPVSEGTIPQYEEFLAAMRRGEVEVPAGVS